MCLAPKQAHSKKTEILGLAQMTWFFKTSQTLISWIQQELFRLQMTSSYSRTLQDLSGDMYDICAHAKDCAKVKAI